MTEQAEPYNVPQWCVDYATHLICAILRPNMPVSFRLSSFEDRPDAGGHCDVDWTYQRATIRLMDTIKPDDEGYEIITHELLHVTQWAQLQAIEQMEGHLKKHDAKLLHALFEAANEQTIQRLTRALTPLFRADFERAQAADANGGQ